MNYYIYYPSLHAWGHVFCFNGHEGYSVDFSKEEGTAFPDRKSAEIIALKHDSVNCPFIILGQDMVDIVSILES